MTGIAEKAKPPAITIYVAGNAGAKAGYIEMLYGIEEEGVPYELVTSDFTDINDLSYEAAISSSLSVGLGINADVIALHYNKLPRDMPIYVIDREIGRRDIWNMGINAARLVKRMPFNTIETARLRRETDVR